MTIDGIDVENDHHAPIVIAKYKNVAIRNGKLLTRVTSEPCIIIYAGCANLTFENLDCWGPKLYSVGGTVTNVKFINCKLNGKLVPNITI